MRNINHRKTNMKLLEQYHNSSDVAQRRKLEQRLVQLNELMVHKKAHLWSKQKNIPVAFEELQQLGYVGLLKAIRNFDISKNFQFSTFAYRHIDGAIMRYMRDKVSFVRIPQTLQGKGEGKVPVGSIKIIALDHEDCILQLEREYEVLDTNERIETLLAHCDGVERPRCDRLRPYFIDLANQLIEKGLIDAEKIKGESLVDKDGTEVLQMSLL